MTNDKEIADSFYKAKATQWGISVEEARENIEAANPRTDWKELHDSICSNLEDKGANPLLNRKDLMDSLKGLDDWYAGDDGDQKSYVAGLGAMLITINYDAGFWVGVKKNKLSLSGSFLYGDGIAFHVDLEAMLLRVLDHNYMDDRDKLIAALKNVLAKIEKGKAIRIKNGEWE